MVPTGPEMVRLVRANATVVKADGSTEEAMVSIRIDWYGSMPEHACVASTCEWCHTQLVRAARRRTHAVRVLNVEILSDGQRRNIQVAS